MTPAGQRGTEQYVVSDFRFRVKFRRTAVASAEAVGRTVLIITLLSVAAGAIQLVSVPDEITIGKQTQMKVKQGTPHVRDATVQAYVARIGRQLAARAKGERYPYSFSVADYREINAFALPGGPVWVNRGAIQSAGTESQLAGVLAHEIAHISQRHAA